MKDDKKPLGSTRRSFMKKSVVAAVAASNLTVFSGLVNASEQGCSGEGEDCVIMRDPGSIPDPDPDNDFLTIEYCWGDPSCNDELNCGAYYLKNADGSWKRDANGNHVEGQRKFKCKDIQTLEEAKAKGNWCITTIIIPPEPDPIPV